jgi:hypothetical protein
VTAPRQGNGGPGGRPLCYDGTPFKQYRANAGIGPDGRMRTVVIPWAFSKVCQSWASHPGTDPVPLAEGWRCPGCRFYPKALVRAALKARKAREERAR